ncbi:MAG: hypothetical protein ACLTGI_11470 [Hoylesella buccalis]
MAYNGKRPYYIVIVGNNENIARLTQDENYEAFAQLSRLRGYENMYLFETDDVYEPYYSLLLSHPQIRGRFQPERGQGTQVTKLEGLKQDRKQWRYQAGIGGRPEQDAHCGRISHGCEQLCG